MIKFIASDIDGTLVDDKKRLPPDFKHVISELDRRGVFFAVASGRQYATLRDDFGDDIMIIAENGSIAFDKGKKIFSSPMPIDDVYRILTELEKYRGFHPILCGEKYAYTYSLDSVAKAEVERYYHRYKVVDNFRSVLDKDEVLKIAVYVPDGAEKAVNAISFTERDAVPILSGNVWLDIMKRGVSKGNAIRKIRDIYGIKREECAAFGDYMNDYEMLRECGESYAMANAYPELKKICKYECKSNNEYGVTEKIKEIFGI